MIICKINIFAMTQKIYVDKTPVGSANIQTLAKTICSIAKDRKQNELLIMGINKKQAEKLISEIKTLNKNIKIKIGGEEVCQNI